MFGWRNTSLAVIIVADDSGAKRVAQSVHRAICGTGEHDKAIAHERPIHHLAKAPRPKRRGETGVHFVKSDFAISIVTAIMNDLVKKRAQSRTNWANR